MRDIQESVTRHFDVTAREFDSIYTGKGRGRLARLLDRALRRDMFERFRLTIEACDAAAGTSVLDVGCGTGRFMIPLAERGAHVVGIDPAPTMIDIARALVGERGLAERCEFVVSDLAGYQADRTFDVVLGIGLFDYLADARSALERMLSLARERVVLTFPRRWTYRAPVRKARLALRGCPVFFYDEADVRKLVSDASGTVEMLRVVGKLYFVIAAPARGRE